jgi:hypothetical protein
VDTDIGALLARAIEAHARASDAAVVVADVQSERWCSATFEGERGVVLLYHAEPPRAWLDAVPDAELPISRHFVADIRVRTVVAGGTELEALVLLEA